MKVIDYPPSDGFRCELLKVPRMIRWLATLRGAKATEKPAAQAG